MAAHASNRTMRRRTRVRAQAVVKPTTSHARALRAGGLALLVIAALCACDVRRDEPVAECIAYAARARKCFGDRVGAHLSQLYSTPPSNRAARDELSAKCSAGRARIARTCK